MRSDTQMDWDRAEHADYAKREHARKVAELIRAAREIVTADDAWLNNPDYQDEVCECVITLRTALRALEGE